MKEYPSKHKKICMEIYYDSDSGEMLESKESKDFENSSDLMRLDVLQDIALYFKTIYHEEKYKFYKHQERAMEKYEEEK